MSRPVILSLGSVNADFQIRIKVPLTGKETLMGHDFCRFSGGKAANVAYLARKLSLDAALIGCVGHDDLAEQALEPLRKVGVDLQYVTRQPVSTGMSMIVVPPDGKKSIVLAGNANDHWDDVSINAMRQAVAQACEQSILVLDYEIDAQVATQAVRLASARRMRVVLDPSPADRIDRKVLSHVYAVTPNVSEAQQLTGTEILDLASAMSAAQRILTWGVTIVCIKLGDGGCVAAGKDWGISVPSPNTRAVDTTGAGDAFTGAFAASLLQGDDAVEAACWGVAASNYAVGHYGSQPAYPSRAEIERQLPRLKKTIQQH